MQEKITLKVGDKISEYNASRVWETDTISSFEDGKTVWLECGNCYSMSSEKYYVNGKRYARENIIVPDFKKENKMEYQEITPENIAEVLEFNKSLGLKVDNIRIEDNCICFNFNGYKQEFEFDDDGDTKWLQHTEIETGKLKPLPKANPFDAVKVGDWVKSKKTLYHYQCQLPYRTKDKWYQRVELNNKKCFVCNSNGSGYSSSDSPCDWDLTDIRDYNPTECVLKIGDEFFSGSGPLRLIMRFDYVNERVHYMSSWSSGSIRFNVFSALIEQIEINGRKYDKITIPKFDFVKCLVDAGFTLNGDGDLYAIGSSWNESIICLEKKDDRQWFLNCSSNLTEATPANAQIIVSMANLAKGIK